MNPVGLGTSPLVSVVIPTRGRPQLVRRAIASAIGQTERKIEIVVVIDGPIRKPNPSWIKSPTVGWCGFRSSRAQAEQKPGTSGRAGREAGGSRCWTTTMSGCRISWLNS